jgi:multidrug resistance efflux pump
MSPHNTNARLAEGSTIERKSGAAQDLDVRERIDLLKQFEHDAAAPRRTAGTGPYSFVWKNTLLRRTLKTAGALAIAMALGFTPVQRLWSITSAEAIVNSRVITLRSPIEGRIVEGPKSIEIGRSLQSGETVLRITNSRADRSRLDDLRRRRSALIDQRQTAAERIAKFDRLRAEQMTQFASFSQGRIAQIEARRREILADQDAIKARLQASEASLNRAMALYTKGFQAQQVYDEVTRENKVLRAALTASNGRLEAADIERASAGQGVFVADGFNDVPRSAQRASELAQLIADLEVTAAEQDRRLEAMQSEIEEETRRFEENSVAVMTSPAAGLVWEVLTSPGEDVHRAQELMRVLDCQQAVVTASVSEANFNKLKIGDKATFRLRGTSKELGGRVIGLHGLASVPANLAINQATLSREPYHATVEVPELATGRSCLIGRTGIVTFDMDASPQQQP